MTDRHRNDAVIRVATWNTKQAVAPRLAADAAWLWMDREIAPHLVVLTEAKIPKVGVPAGWVAEWEPDGFGPKRRWGTVVAATGGLTLERLHEVRIGRRNHQLAPRWPAAAIAADVFVGRERWATIVGMYGFTVDLDGASVGHGRVSMPALLDDLAPLLESDRADRLIIAGDFNVWPSDAYRIFSSLDLTDLIEWTSSDRDSPLDGCCGCDLGDDCGHLWTHKNPGGKNPSVQQIDFILAGPGLCKELGEVYGGYADFPHAEAASDHAPVVAEFGR